MKLAGKKYGTAPTNELLKDGMKFGFKRMHIFHESILSMVTVTVKCYTTD